jgi:membrane associated rhomboid family serine protease
MVYGRGERGSSPVVYTILAVNLVVFVLWQTPTVLPWMVEHFLVSWTYLQEGKVWTLLTAAFSHHAMFHLLVNMIVLMSFGPPMERLMGARRFISFYLVAGAVGSLAHAGVSTFLMDRPGQPALGASAALAGILILFAFTFPRATILLFFVIPLPALVAALLFVGIDVWGLIMQIGANGDWPIGHGAHLGGALTGIVYFLVRGRPVPPPVEAYALPAEEREFLAPRSAEVEDDEYRAAPEDGYLPEVEGDLPPPGPEEEPRR